MTERQKILVSNVEKQKEMILEAERWLWKHPQTGFTEWQAHQYLAEKFEAMGYELTLAGNIPGFYADLDTGKPGPKVCIMAELDALDIKNHPESVNGMAHCCGHHGQGAALLGVAAALKEHGALSDMCGSIRLMLVPAEEMIQLEYREELRKEGEIGYVGGKTEFMARGFFDDVDLSFMVHEGGRRDGVVYDACYGYIGCMAKTFIFKGKSSHAGSSAPAGINAQYAAMLGLQACNDLRETFRDEENIRFHPIMNGVNCAVNIIPDEMKLESYLRGRTIEAIKRENKKINRALAGAALALGARVELHDRPGYAPAQLDRNFMKLAEQCCIDLVGADYVKFNYESWATGSTDFGDLTCVMPCVLFNSCGGYTGAAHSIDYHIDNPYRLCVDSAKAQVLVAEALLKDNAAAAKDIIDKFEPRFPSVKDYLKSLNQMFLDKEAVVYDSEGHAAIDFFND